MASGVMSRRKGKTAEREVARLLQEWWQQVEPECRFVTTPSSGGWATAQVRGEFRASGDVMTTARLFPWVVEVKRRESWSLTSVLRSKRSPVWEWWRQAKQQASEVGGVPMLWVRKSREPWRVLVSRQDGFGSHDRMLVTIACQHVGCDFDSMLLMLGGDLLFADPSAFAKKTLRGWPHTERVAR